MNADTQIDLDAMHEAVIAKIAAQFPGVTVDDYPDDRRRIRAPAVLVELVELAPVPDEDPGTGQLALEAHFEARYLVGFRGPDQRRHLRRTIATLAHFIQHNRWGLPVEPARVTGCAPDEFSPELDQYHVWAVEWAQIVHIGPNEWITDDFTPTEVYVGIEPLTGPEHVDDYRRVDQEGTP